MPPKRKQTPRNGFFYFMQDFKNRQGKNFRSMKEVADAAGPHWSKMSKEQKFPYEEKALMEKNNLKGSKLTSEGLDVEDLELKDKLEHQKVQAMKEEINFNLGVAAKGGRLHREMFFIVHVNIFCYCGSQNRYYPAEIAIAGFSLDEGVKEECVFHRIIKPGPLPLGYAFDANVRSKESHNIPPPMTGDTDYNMSEVYEDLKHFLTENSKGSKQYPILYTDEKMLKVVQDVLNMMCYDYEEQENLFRVYSLQYMFRALKNNAAGSPVWNSDTYSAREIEKDLNAHTKGICCEFHETTNTFTHCSRSVVVRYSYTICDNCCPSLHIPLVPGKHVPKNAILPTWDSGSTLSLNSQSSKYSSNFKQTTRDDDTDSVVSFSGTSEWDRQSEYTDPTSSFGATKFDADDYPPLRETPSRNSSNSFDTASDGSTFKSSRSYAGCMGPSGLGRKPAAMPSSLCESFEKVGINDDSSENSFSTNYPVLGRGRGRKPRN